MTRHVALLKGVIPEGEQFVKQREARFCSSRASLDLTADARRCQGWVKAGGAARRGSLDPAAAQGRMLAEVEWGCSVDGHCLVFDRWDTRFRLQIRSVLRGAKARTRLPVIPAPYVGMECCGNQPDGVNQFRGHAGKRGPDPLATTRPVGVRCASRRLLDGPRTDGAVPKAVEDEGDDLSRHGDPGDLAGTGAVAVMSGDANKVGS